MTAETILYDLMARGVRIWAEADSLKLDAPAGSLTDADLADLRARKAELLATLKSEARTCLDCGDSLDLQSKARDVWWCAGCRTFCDGSGRLLDPPKVRQPLTLELSEAQRLLADLLAAGCGFVLEDDELRLTHPSRMPAALWMRFEASGQDFGRLARNYVLERADAHITESQMVN